MSYNSRWILRTWGAAMEQRDMAGILMQGRLTISDEIYNRILMKIIEGQWQVGDKLPSEKQLCELFGASRVSVRTALSRLAARGITVIENSRYVERGYEQIEKDLQQLGASVRLEADTAGEERR